MVRFRFLTGDIDWQIYGGKFVSQKLNNGDWDYYMVIDVVNWHEATGEEDQPKYCIELQAVSPEAAGKKNLDSAFSSFGLSDDQMERLENDPLIQVEALATYGIYSPLKQFTGNNLNQLMREARREAQIAESLFGFYMDAPKNRLGQDGWDVIRGQDIREFLGIESHE